MLPITARSWMSIRRSSCTSAKSKASRAACASSSKARQAKRTHPNDHGISRLPGLDHAHADLIDSKPPPEIEAQLPHKMRNGGDLELLLLSHLNLNARI